MILAPYHTYCSKTGSFVVVVVVALFEGMSDGGSTQRITRRALFHREGSGVPQLQ